MPPHIFSAGAAPGFVLVPPVLLDPAAAAGCGSRVTVPGSRGGGEDVEQAEINETSSKPWSFSIVPGF